MSSSSSSSVSSSSPSSSSTASVSSTPSKLKKHSKAASSYHNFVGIDLRKLREKRNATRVPFCLLFEPNLDLESGDSYEGDSRLDLDYGVTTSSSRMAKKASLPREKPPRKRQKTYEQTAVQIFSLADDSIKSSWKMYEEKDGEEVAEPSRARNNSSHRFTAENHHDEEVESDIPQEGKDDEGKENIFIGNHGTNLTSSIFQHNIISE
ncbi:hypothetical protein BY996DRAFT_6413962 [Phakopsora pachyrhizi]|uniref:Expressed protein n=1 Tax=Phakopsora pachyrhizi TaxID=170000 RepID=A0AAV0BF56_PHAPC|nr:hypothetical protein BY996DRAFT_6413962 [Phakopsora pachyrhizi]CAH7683993.1 expressed protein [Phakopsora pachyrhizi]CAH7686344.1 expressed protein [Phakopsora pachyrhizi]